MKEEKKRLRRKCFAAIRGLSPEEKRGASTAICGRLEKLPAFIEADTVFAYLPLPSEPDLTPLFDRFPDKVWAFARVLSDDEMEFRRMTDLSDSIEGEFKIKEPDPEKSSIVDKTEANLVLIPGVGFDIENKARLGRGKGHYDRYLSPLLSLPNRPKLVGICFAAQQCEIEAEAHDVPMDLVIVG